MIGFVIDATRTIVALELAGARDVDVVATRDERGGTRHRPLRNRSVDELLQCQRARAASRSAGGGASSASRLTRPA